MLSESEISAMPDPPPGDAVQVCRTDVALGVRAILRHAEPGTVMAPRSFPEKGSGSATIYPPIAIPADGNLDPVIDAFFTYAEQAAAQQKVFAPPFATYRDGSSAAADNLANALALVVDKDGGAPHRRSHRRPRGSDRTCHDRHDLRRNLRGCLRP